VAVLSQVTGIPEFVKAALSCRNSCGLVTTTVTR
jgi:hypothetical protein